MNAPDILRQAADTLESVVVSEREEQTIKLMCLHILRCCDFSGLEAEEARLLMEMLNGG